MKFIVEVSFPTVPFNRMVRDGTIGQKMGRRWGPSSRRSRPHDDRRSRRRFAGPHVTEPLMLTFEASVHDRVAMSPEQLAAAGLEKYAET
jgi:hypothetical protein